MADSKSEEDNERLRNKCTNTDKEERWNERWGGIEESGLQAY